MRPRISVLKYGLAGLITLIIFAIAVSSCGDFKKSSVVAPPSNGTLDFTSFVSLGNSLTAGYQSGALFESAQIWSYPADIAKQAGAADFVQPLMADPGTGSLMSVTSLSGPDVHTASTMIIPPINESYTLPYNNLGIPGAILYDLTDTTDFNTKSVARNNPFFSLILRSKVFGSSAVEQALALHPTFMTVWIGANDVLGYATSGGTGALPTDQSLWAGMYTQTMSALLAGAPNAKFAVANIPDITAIPFFTTVPDSIPYLGKNVGAFIVERHHADGSLHVEPINAKTDYILLSAIDLIDAGVGVPASLGGTNAPLPDSLVLDSLEVANVEEAISSYNSTIAAFVNLPTNQSRVVMVDAYSALNTFAQYGYVAQGVVLTKSYISGGFFGLDGIHPTSQGYAYVANLFIQAINSHFGSNIPIVPISSVPGSIMFGNSSMSNLGLPNIHYSDLKTTLQLIHRRDLP